MAVSKAQQHAVDKYKWKNYDFYSLRFPKDTREDLKVRIANAGYSSFNSFILEAINEKLERENI